MARPNRVDFHALGLDFDLFALHLGAMLVVSSVIESVTVFHSGARVTRVAELAADGEYPAEIRLAGLPLALDDGSLKVRVGADDDDAVPVANALRVVLEVPQSDGKLAPSDDTELEQVRVEAAVLEDLITRVEREMERLKYLSIKARPDNKKGEPPAPSPTASRLALLAYRDRELERLRADFDSARKKLRETQHRLQELEEQNRLAQRTRMATEDELRKSAVIVLGNRDAAVKRVRVALEYMVPGARWAPAYALRLQSESAAELDVRAVVVQETGEDWTDVALTLSTADADRWSEVPELTSIRIGRPKPYVAKPGWRPAPAGASEMYSDFDRTFAKLPRGVPKRAPEAGRLNVPVDWDMSGDETMSGFGGMAEEAVMDDLDMTNEMEAAPPPMAAMAAPVPAASMVVIDRKRTRTGGRAADKSGSTAGKLNVAAHAVIVSGIRGQVDQREEAFAESEIRAGQDMLTYASLRMPAAQAANRGQLVRADEAELYMELLLTQRIDVRFSVVATIETARRVAHAAGAKPLPSGHCFEKPESFDYAFVAETAIRVPSDGEFHSIPLLARETHTKSRFVAVPRESTDVFRFAEIKNPFDAPLLRGPTDVYVGPEFLLTTDMRFTPPNGEIRVGLGVEQSIKLARNARFFEDSAGFLGGSRKLEHQIHIELKNNLKRSVEVEVRERLPVPDSVESDDVKVDIVRVEPAWKPYKPTADSPERHLRGGHVWTVDVAANSSVDLHADYAVVISAKHELVGGNRREV